MSSAASTSWLTGQRGHSSLSYLGLAGILIGVSGAVVSTLEREAVPSAVCRIANRLGSNQVCGEPENERADSTSLEDLRSMPWIEGSVNPDEGPARSGYIPVAIDGDGTIADPAARDWLYGELEDVSAMLPLEVTGQLADMIYYEAPDFYFGQLNRQLLEYRLALARDYLSEQSRLITGRTVKTTLLPLDQLPGTITREHALEQVAGMVRTARRLRAQYERTGYFGSNLYAETRVANSAKERRGRVKGTLGDRSDEILQLGPPYDVDPSDLDGLFFHEL